jgi:nitrous oxidase accessory protein
MGLTSIAAVGKASILVVKGSGEALRMAIASAQSNDTILVESGYYRADQLIIDKPLVLLGTNFPVIDSHGGDEIFVIQSDSVTIAGFQLQNIGVSFTKDRAAIRLVKVKYVTIRNNRLDNTFFGIYLQDSSDCVIRDNRIIGSSTSEINAGNAIHIWKGERIIVANNHLENHRDGIYFEFVDNSLISGNTSVNNMRYGLHFMFSNKDTYEHNTFKNNGAGVAVMFSKFIEMYHNTFEENWGGASYGILLKEITDGRMKYNTFYRNTVGIYAEGANRMLIEENRFIANGKALDIKGNCMDNKVLKNDFLGNTFEVVANSKDNLNLYEGNYWSQYRGYDLDRDGIGDVPHRPVNLFSLITEHIPASGMLLHSFLINSLDVAERVFPQLIPEHLIDEKPSMKPVVPYDQH